MKVVTVGSFKGGAGKTTTALLMAQLWRYKYSIAIIDLNPMPQGRDWAIAVGLHAGHLPNAGASELHAAIRSLHFDLVIIDAPPATDAAVGAAVAFSDVVLIPFRPSEWEFAGLEVLTMSIVHTIERKQVPPRIIGIPSRDDPRRKKARFSPPALPFEVLYTPPIHRWAVIEHAASTHGDLYTPFAFTKPEQEIHACSKFIVKNAFV